MGLGFPGGTVVKNLPANAGDTGSNPGPGRTHMPRNNKAHAQKLLSLHSRAREPQLLKPTCLEPVLCYERSHRKKKTEHHNEELQLEKAHTQQRRPNEAKNKYIF